MAIGRSFWKLPQPLQAQVKTPTLNALREWDFDTAERKYGASNQKADDDNDDMRQKREEVLAKCRTQAIRDQADSSTRVVSLEERMALAAQKRKATEVQHSASGNRVPATASSSEYLNLVRQLQHHDNGEAGTGGKWLVSKSASRAASASRASSLLRALVLTTLRMTQIIFTDWLKEFMHEWRDERFLCCYPPQHNGLLPATEHLRERLRGFAVQEAIKRLTRN